MLAKGTQFGAPGQVLVFASSAQGDVAPVRAFTDASSQFVDAAGIALVYESITASVSPAESGSVPQLAVGPDPTSGVMNGRLWLPRAVSALRMQVIDAAGRTVATLWYGDAPAGALDAHWDGRAAGRTATPGVYMLLVRGDGLQVQRRFVVIR